MVLLPFFILAALFGSPVLNFLLGPGFGDNIHLFLALFALSIISISYVGLHPFFLALGKAREDSLISLVSNVFYLGLVFVLISLIGVWAVVVATAIQYAITIVAKLVIVHKVLRDGEVNGEI